MGVIDSAIGDPPPQVCIKKIGLSQCLTSKKAAFGEGLNTEVAPSTCHTYFLHVLKIFLPLFKRTRSCGGEVPVPRGTGGRRYSRPRYHWQGDTLIFLLSARLIVKIWRWLISLTPSPLAMWTVPRTVQQIRLQTVSLIVRIGAALEQKVESIMSCSEQNWRISRRGSATLRQSEDDSGFLTESATSLHLNCTLF